LGLIGLIELIEFFKILNIKKPFQINETVLIILKNGFYNFII